MSKEAIDALLDAVDDELGVCEIEPIMYVKMRKNGRNKLYSIITVEKFVSLVNRRGILLISDLVKEKPSRLIKSERTMSTDMIGYASFALMNMHLRERCERMFRKALYQGDLLLTLRSKKPELQDAYA